MAFRCQNVTGSHEPEAFLVNVGDWIKASGMLQGTVMVDKPQASVARSLSDSLSQSPPASGTLFSDCYGLLWQEL